MSPIRAVMDEMFEDCVRCDGVGTSGSAAPDGTGPPRWCHTCNGRGITLSENGSMLIDALLPFLGEHYAEKDHGHHLS